MRIIFSSVIMAAAILGVAIAGATCSGKTSLANLLQEDFPHSVLIHQDKFYLKEELLTKSNSMYNWDHVSSLNQKGLVSAVENAFLEPHVLCQHCGHTCENPVTHLIVVEGTMILAMDNLRSYFNTSFFLTLDKATCRQRRVKRKYEGEPDPPKYFDNCIWPSFQHMYDIATSYKSVILDSCSLSLQDMRRIVVAHIAAL